MKFTKALSFVRIPVILVGILAGLAITYPNSISNIYDDLRCYSKNNQSIENAQQVRAELNDRAQDVYQRIQAKQTIIHEIMQNQIELPEAAEKFLALNMHDKNIMRLHRELYQGSTDLERSALNIIDYVKYNQPGAKAKPVIARLQEQYRNHFGYPVPTRNNLNADAVR